MEEFGIGVNNLIPCQSRILSCVDLLIAAEYTEVDYSDLFTSGFA